MLRTQCPTCEQIVSLSDDALGKKGRCNRCGSVFVIEAMRAAATPSWQDRHIDAKVGKTAAIVLPAMTKMRASGRVRSRRYHALLIGLAAFIVISLVLLSAFLRIRLFPSDASDDISRLAELNSLAHRAFVQKDYVSAVSRYDEFFELLGERKTTNPDLQRIMDTATPEYAIARERRDSEMARAQSEHQHQQQQQQQVPDATPEGREFLGKVAEGIEQNHPSMFKKTSLDETTRRQIYLEMYEAIDSAEARGVVNYDYRPEISSRFGITNEQVNSIVVEGLQKQWPDRR